MLAWISKSIEAEEVSLKSKNPKNNPKKESENEAGS